jgi:uncharacterized protein
LNSRETKESNRNTPIWAAIRVFGFMSLMWVCLLLIGDVIRLFDSNLLASLGPYSISFSEFVLTVISVGLVYLFQLKDFPKYLSEIKLKNRSAFAEIFAGFVLGTIMLGIMFGVTYLCGSFTVSKVNWPVDLLPGLTLYLFAGFTEEWIFRGFIFRVVEKSSGTVAAILVSSLLFGFAHVVNMPEKAHLGYIIYACTLLSFEAGLPLAGAYLYRRSLWLPVGVHWAWNFLEGTVFGVSVSGTDPGATILTSKLTGNEFMSGGVFGPEASIPFFLVGTMFGSALLYAAHKKGNWLLTGQSLLQKDAVPVSPTDL